MSDATGVKLAIRKDYHKTYTVSCPKGWRMHTSDPTKKPVHSVRFLFETKKRVMGWVEFNEPSVMKCDCEKCSA